MIRQKILLFLKCLTLQISIALTCSLFPITSTAADISGRVVDDAGNFLKGIQICLKSEPSSLKDCTRIKRTDAKGNYEFKGLKPGSSYSLRIHLDRDAKQRKYQQFKNFVWEPLIQNLEIRNRRDQVNLRDFVGKFDFSNFQRVIKLVSADFPEFGGIDTSKESVALRVYIKAEGDSNESQTIFLGQVVDPNSLWIEASIPRSVRQIQYEILRVGQSTYGLISLSED